MLLRRLGLLCERGYRPSGRGHRRQRPAHHPGDIAAAAILLDRGWGKAKEMARAQRAKLAARPLLSISAFRAKFGLSVIWLSAVRVGSLFRVATRVAGERPGFQAWNAT